MASVTETVQIAARVPVSDHTELVMLAEKADRSVSAELRRAIRFYVEQKKAAA